MRWADLGSTFDGPAGGWIRLGVRAVCNESCFGGGATLTGDSGRRARAELGSLRCPFIVTQRFAPIRAFIDASVYCADDEFRG